MNISRWIHTSNKALLCKSMDWFLYDRDLRHERVKTLFTHHTLKVCFYMSQSRISFFFSIWVFFHEYSRFKGQQVKGKAFSLYPFYHFHLFHRHLDIYRVIATGSSPLRIADIRQPLSNREPLAFWLKSRTIKLRTLENLLFLYLHC